MDNKTARKFLEKRYGKGCFMERAGIREITPEEERKLKKIKGYKKLDRRMSYHHIEEKHLGGKATVENGANLAVYNHEWLHRQPPEVKDEINKKLQDFKMAIDMARLYIGDDSIEFEKLGRLDFDFSDCITIKLYDDTEEDIKKRNKFNRAKVKRETQNMIEDELYR